MLNVAGTDPWSFGTQWPSSSAWLSAVLGVTSAFDATCAPPEPGSTAYVFYNDSAFYNSAWLSAAENYAVSGGTMADNSVGASVVYAAFSSLGAYGWVPKLFDTEQPDLALQARLPGRGLVLGGAALTQRRFAPGPCPAGSNFSALGGGGGGGCVTTGGASTAPFGLALTADTGASTTRPAFDGTPLPLGRAFAASAVPGSPKTGAAFRAWLPAFAPVPTTLCREVGFLLDKGWVDEATESLELSFAVLNQELGRVAHVRLLARASGGGLWSHAWRAQSVLLAPYGPAALGAGAGRPPQPGLALALDVLLCAYLAYLVASVCKRGARGCILAAADARRAQGGRGACLNVCTCAAFLPARLPPLAVAVDWFAVAALSAAIGTWAAHAADLAALNGALAALPPLVPALLDGGVDPALWAPARGSVPPSPGGPPPWATVEALAGVAVDSFAAFQTAATLALIGLTVRTLKYMTFQAHLAVLFNTLRASCSTMAHFSLPLVTGFVMFGVWGMFTFGHLTAQWSNTKDAALSVMRFLMYDYDFAFMQYSDGSGLFGLYWVLFMMGMTNIMLWLVRCAAWAPETARHQMHAREALTPPPPPHPPPKKKDKGRTSY